MAQLSVLQVLPELNSGGVERGTLEIGAALVARGDQSTVLSNGGRLVATLESQGSEHVSLPVHRKSPWSLRLIPKLRALLPAYNLVHVRSRMPAWLTYLAWKSLSPALRPRLVSTVHGLYSVNGYSAVMTRGERVIAISECVREYILENYPATDPARLRLIHRGVDPDEFPRCYRAAESWRSDFYAAFPATEHALRIALPARITRWKGHTTFLELLARLTDVGGRAVHGLFIGDADRKRQPFLKELKGRAKSLGISDRLHFLGHRSDMREVLSECHLTYNLSTHPEPFGRTMIEAMSLGVPVVAWNYGGAAESVAALFPEGLVPPGDVEALVRTSRAVLAEPDKMPAPNTFLRSRMQADTLAVYDELAALPRS
ncbi:MAG: glycosyltransferase family 4 protein [Pseudomonadota bacterium]